MQFINSHNEMEGVRPEPSVPKAYQHRLDASVMQLRHPLHIPLAARFNARAIILPAPTDMPTITAAMTLERRVRHRDGHILDVDFKDAAELGDKCRAAKIPEALIDYVVERERTIYSQLAKTTQDRRLRFIATGAASAWHRDTLNNVYVETIIGADGTRVANRHSDISLTNSDLAQPDVEAEIARHAVINVPVGSGVLFNLNWAEGQIQDYDVTGVIHASPPTSMKKGGVPRLAIGFGMGDR